jgi:hypothetical protein
MREAVRQNTTFQWKLVEACGIGHSSSGMMKASEMRYALGIIGDKMKNQHLCTNEQVQNDNKRNVNDAQTARPKRSLPYSTSTR